MVNEQRAFPEGESFVLAIQDQDISTSTNNYNKFLLKDKMPQRTNHGNTIRKP